MIILDNSHLMMIEPNSKVLTAIDDSYTLMAEDLYGLTEPKHATRGWHTCICGENSTNTSHVLPCGVVTNSLLVYYVREHRSEVPKEELNKLTKLWEKHCNNG